MKIKILYNFDIIFGYAAEAWNAWFNRNGHESIFVNVLPNSADHYQQGFAADINLFIGSPTLFRIIERIGYPKTGKNILWMLDPLTSTSACHFEKLLSFEAIDNKFDGIACMDKQIQAYFAQRFPSLPLLEVPYVVDESRILEPMPEQDKIIDVLMLGRKTFRRDSVVENLHAAGLNVNYMYHQCWGEKRKKVLQNTKLSLQVAMDDYAYFDQFRVFEACAHGALVIGPVMPDMQKYGFSNGLNMVECDLADMPRICSDLLWNDAFRSRIIHNAQSHLRECYTVQKQGGNMLALFKSVL